MRTPACALAVALGGCGTDALPPCGDREIFPAHDQACLNAQMIAARHTNRIRPAADEIAHVLSVYRSALLSKPTLCFLQAQMWWGRPYEVEFTVESPDVAATWTTGELTTGIAALDDALAAGGASEVLLRSERLRRYMVTFRYAVNPENLRAALAGIGVTVATEFYAHPEGMEVALEPPSFSAPVDVIFRHGWGDCNVACTGNHWWRVHVDADLSSELVEEWGAEIPADEIPRMEARAADVCPP